MSNLITIQENYKEHLQALSAAELELQQTRAALEQLIDEERSSLRGTVNHLRKERMKLYAGRKKSLGDKIAAASSLKERLNGAFNHKTKGFLDELNPVVHASELKDAFPILLFPLRLEIRFKSVDGKQQLWLRVYPDDCNINKKEPLLSGSELNNAKDFWMETWKAGGIETDEKAAWRSFVNSHGSGRAAWIIQQYKPGGVKPLRPDSSYKILVIASSLLLTAAEETAANNYWKSYWLANGNAQLISNAENDLQTAIGAARSGEIKKDYVPFNIGDAVPDGITASRLSIERVSFNDYTPAASSWTKAAEAVAMPDKFAAVLYKGTIKRTVVFSNPVRDKLPVSADPSLDDSEQFKKDDHGNLIVNKDLQWMVDFEKAVEAGMGMSIDLNADEAVSGFDKLFVIGLRFRSDEIQAQQELEQLLSDHFYSKEGFALLRQGTPTNNTEDEGSGYSWSDDSDESFERIFRHREDFDEIADPVKKSDGEKLADCLGIQSSILKLVPQANGKDQAHANSMNAALFPATLGYFMEEMMHPLFTDRDIEATRVFFSNFVSGRGPVPAIRIGRQPYGILPVSVQSRLNFSNVNTDGSVNDSFLSYPQRLHNLLIKLDKSWDGLVANASHIGKAGDPHQVLLDVIGLQATSVEFHQRYSQTLLQLYNQLALQSGPLFATSIAAAIAQRGKVILQELGLGPDLKLPILERYFLSNPNLLSGPFIDDVPNSEKLPVRPYAASGANYIQWLAESTADMIRLEDFGGNASPKALLYLLLRHALMLAQADAASQLLVDNGVVQSKKEFYDPEFLHVQAKDSGKSKFEHLYSNFPAITGSTNLKLAEYIYTPVVLTSEEAVRKLKETIDALSQLKDVPTAALERLLAEHLDCCNYRIDAWKTGLVNYKLTEQRHLGQQGESVSKGIYLGAFGWLTDVKPSGKQLVPVQLEPELQAIFETDPLFSDPGNLGYIHAPSLNQAATAAVLRSAYDTNHDPGNDNLFAINLRSNRIRKANEFLDGMRNGQSLSALLGYQFERGLHDKYSLGQGEVDLFIYPLRKAFPLVADNITDTVTPPGESIQNIAASNVLDGLKLIQHIKEKKNRQYPFSLPAELNMPGANAVQAQAINTEVERLFDTNDAIADLVLSEQVYQVVQGNFERAAGNAEAFSKGSYPPEIEVKDTPRTGITLTHRTAIQFDATINSTPDQNPRAKAEPSVNKWLADQLPPSAKIRCRVLWSSPVQAETEAILSLADLQLDPVDFLYILNMEETNSLTELDDRIYRYIRYIISKHPGTNITILYSSIVDEGDSSVISFFEMASLAKVLRKILSGNSYLKPSQVSVTQDSKELPGEWDLTKLRARVAELKSGLDGMKMQVQVIADGAVSIASTSGHFKAVLETAVTDPMARDNLVNQFIQDLKDYVINPTHDSRTAILDNFDAAINFINDPTVKNVLKTSYENGLINYAADFSLMDQLAEGTGNVFLNIALFDSAQTGAGFIQRGIRAVYDSVYAKLAALIKRWNQKQSDFTSVMAGYDVTGVPVDQFELLREAEAFLSTKTAEGTAADFVLFKNNIIDPLKTAFDNLLGDLTALRSNGNQKVTGFIADAEILLGEIAGHDALSFDTVNRRNNLKAEKLLLVSLKEDICAALANMLVALSAKSIACSRLITDADGTVNADDKVSLLLQAAQKILTEEALLLPQFTFLNPLAAEFENSYSAGLAGSTLDFVKTLENRNLPVEEWMAGVARVRERMESWEEINFLMNAFNASSELPLTPLQFPYQDHDRWLALKFRDENNPNDQFSIDNAKLLYTAHFSVPFDKTKTQCGIVIDEWTETIPSGKETTGISFHYDQPGSEPPQTMLLVVPPQIKGNWQWEDIVDTIDETLSMAAKRAVEPSQIESTSLAQFLPNTMMAVTMHWITVATNLAVNNDIYKTINSN